MFVIGNLNTGPIKDIWTKSLPRVPLAEEQSVWSITAQGNHLEWSLHQVIFLVEAVIYLQNMYFDDSKYNYYLKIYV